MEFGVLGRLTVARDGQDVAPRGALQRRLLCALLLRANALSSTDELAEILWPAGLPANHLAALQTHVFRLRRLLPDGAVDSGPAGYRLTVDPAAVDAVRFEAGIYAAAEVRATDPATAATRLDEVLRWWRGTPYDELADVDHARIEATRLTELRLRASEERFDCLLDLGRHGEIVAGLDAFAAHQPLRERPQAQLMLALHRCGRRADALAVYERYRRALGEELGIDPSAALRRFHDDIVVGTIDVPPPVPSPIAPVDPASQAPAPTTATTAEKGPDSAATAGAEAPTPPVRALASPLNDVVRYATSFLGRDDLVADVLDRIGRERLVTLLGTGGVGKTRTAAEVCARAAERFGGAVWFCELAAADPSSVVLTVAAALGIDGRAGVDHRARIAEVLRFQHGLVVLDNCEHVIDAAADLAEAILAGAPDSRILATSRERLAVDGEHLCVVPPLPRPQADHTTADDARTAGGVGDEPAVRLFVDRARAVLPGWEPSPDELLTVAEVCRRLDGLPLAIELAAARLHTLTLSEVADGIETRFRLLTGGRRTTARHRSLAAAVSWSYDLLDPREQAMFEAIALFQSPFRAAGAAALLDTDDAEAIDLLSALVERSLVHRAGERYGMLETLRHFGVERLAHQGRIAALRARHADYHLGLAADAARRLHEAGTTTVLAELDASLGDLRAAQRFLAHHGTHDDRLRFAVSLREYGFYRNRAEVLGWAEDAARRARADGSTDRRIAEAFSLASIEAWNRGDIGRGTELIEQAHAAMQASGTSVHYVLECLGHHDLIKGRLAEAVTWHDAALATQAARDDEFLRVESHASRVLARGYGGSPETDEDVAALLDALTDDTPEVAAAWAWYALGEIVVQTDPPVAAERLQRSLDLADRNGVLFVASVAGASAASIEARHGDALVAVARYRQLLAQGQRAGVRVLQWTMLRSVAELLVRLGCPEPAAVLLGAVTETRSGNEVFGADLERLADVDRAVRAGLGDEQAERAVAAGRRMDDDDAVAVAFAAFDLVTATGTAPATGDDSV